MKDRSCKPNPALGAGLLLSAAAQLNHRSGFLPGFLSCFLTGLSIVLILLGIISADERRAARLRAWKHRLLKGGHSC